MNLTGFILIITTFTGAVVGDSEKSSRALHYKPRSEDLNIEHIISLWNKSVTEDAINNVPWTTTHKNIINTNHKIQNEENLIKTKERIPDNFPSRFTYCLKKNTVSVREYPDQKILIKCLKIELITKLHQLLKNPENNIKLFNGYLEFQKIDEKYSRDNEIDSKETNNSLPIKKKYSSKISSKSTEPDSKSDPFVEIPLKQPKVGSNHGNDYYENYKKMLRELVARKNGAELSRRKRDDRSKTLEKSARLFENGRKLFSEITNNLENDEEHVETLTQSILDPDLVSSINNFTKAYSLRLNFYPGIAARMTRNENSGVTFDLELDDVNEAEEDVVTENSDNGGRGGKKKKGNKKISKKTLKKLFPYLLIPFMIQAALLPIVLKFLLFIAIKALIAGKLALILVAFNAIRNASLKSDEDEYIERVSYDHYGYGGGEEYGAWINRREFVVPGNNEARDNADEYVEPYAAYRPDKVKDQ